MADQEATPEAEAASASETPAPWGEDFNPERAWNTISHLRGVEKELEPKAKQYERLVNGEDPDAVQEILEKYGYEISNDDDEEEETDELAEWEDPTAAELAALKKEQAELKAWKDAQEGMQQVAAFESTVDALAEKDHVELEDFHKLYIAQQVSGNPTPKAIEKAYTDLKSRLEEGQKKTIGNHIKSKSAPSGPGGGESASEVPDLNSRAEIVAHMQSKMQQD